MKKGLMLINNQVEDVEALASRALLIRYGYSIDTFTLEDSKRLKTAYNQLIEVDYLVDEVDYKLYDFLVLPGGKHVFNWVDQDTILNEMILYFSNNKKLIAAICAAPLFLNKANLLEGKEFTIFHGLENDVNGIFDSKAKVITSDNIITGRSAGVVYDFVFEIIKYFDKIEATGKLKLDIIY